MNEKPRTTGVNKAESRTFRTIFHLTKGTLKATFLSTLGSYAAQNKIYTEALLPLPVT